MPIVRMPDGVNVNFPNEMPKEQIKGLITSKFPDVAAPPPQQQKGFTGRVADDLNKRVNNTMASMKIGMSGQQSPAETGLQMAGQAAGFLNDTVGEGFKSGYNALPEPVQKVGKDVLNYVAASPVGDLARTAANVYGTFEQNNPRAARNVNAVANVGSYLSAITPVKGNSAVGAVADVATLPLNKVGSALYNSGEKAFQAKRKGFLQELITPKETPTVKADLFSRSKEKGLLRTRVTEPNPQELAMMDILSTLPVKKNQSLLKNYNVIEEANSKEAKSLISRLQENDIAIPDDVIQNELVGLRQGLSQNPYITGSGETAAERVLNGALDKIISQPQTASGLLQARKEFDSWVKSQKGSKVFDPATDSPVSTAIQQVRQSINNMVDQAVPDAGVKASLAKQSNLYRAMDAIETKGGSEGKNIFKRAADKAADLVPGKSMGAKAAVLATAAAGGFTAPVAAGVAGGAYLAGKALKKIPVRKGLGAALMAPNKVMKKVAALPLVVQVTPKDK